MAQSSRASMPLRNLNPKPEATMSNGYVKPVLDSRGRSSRSTFAVAMTIACAVAALSAMVTPAAAQTSNSYAQVQDNFHSANTCSNSNSGTGTSSASCSANVTGGSGSATSSSNNSTRTSSASTTLTQTGANNSMDAFNAAYSAQTSSLTVSGTSSSADNVVFHFLTPTSGGTGLGGNTGTYSFWELYLAPTSGGYAEEHTNFYGDGTSSFYNTANAQTTLTGVDFTIPLSSLAGDYYFEAVAEASNPDVGSMGTTQSASLTATLDGADLVDANGNHVASASFNADGTGVFDLTTSTVPEPSSMAMIATGLAGLVPVIRKRRT